VRRHHNVCEVGKGVRGTHRRARHHFAPRSHTSHPAGGVRSHPTPCAVTPTPCEVHPWGPLAGAAATRRAWATSVFPVALTGEQVGGRGLDDLTLVVRAQEGDVRAFEVLARRHQRALYRVAVRLTGDPAEAEDAVQEALLDAWRHLDRFRGDATFSTWMYRIVSNRCAAVLRRRRPRPEADAGAQVAAPDSPEQAAELDAELAALGRAVQDLPYDQRVCWVLRELSGMGYAEIAEITSAGEVAVRGRIYRARVRLAEVMRVWR
jgi:RNA polymerase sigma-70 factor, ECF subfamily